MEIRVTRKNKGTSHGTLTQTPDLENFASVYRSSKRVINLVRSHERDKLDRRRSTELTIPPSSDARPLVYHGNHQALSTARFRREGLLATASTCRCINKTVPAVEETAADTNLLYIAQALTLPVHL